MNLTEKRKWIDDELSKLVDSYDFILDYKWLTNARFMIMTEDKPNLSLRSNFVINKTINKFIMSAPFNIIKTGNIKKYENEGYRTNEYLIEITKEPSIKIARALDLLLKRKEPDGYIKYEMTDDSIMIYRESIAYEVIETTIELLKQMGLKQNEQFNLFGDDELNDVFHIVFYKDLK